MLRGQLDYNVGPVRSSVTPPGSKYVIEVPGPLGSSVSMLGRLTTAKQTSALRLLG